jgi:hypothetical protein
MAVEVSIRIRYGNYDDEVNTAPRRRTERTLGKIFEGNQLHLAGSRGTSITEPHLSNHLRKYWDLVVRDMRYTPVGV